MATANTTYTSDTGKSYDFNTATRLNSLLVKVLKNTGQLVAGESYDLDFDHQFIETEKYDAKMTYKKFTGYSPGMAVIGDLVMGIENRDGNANVRFHQQDTLRAETVVGVNSHQYSYALGTIFNDIVADCEKIGDYVMNIVEARLGKHLLSYGGLCLNLDIVSRTGFGYVFED